MKIFRLILVWSVLALQVACGLQYIDRPLPREADLWKKVNFSRQEIDRALWEECGYKNKGWTIDLQEKVDLCMLSKGFTFIDSPYGDFGSRCKHDEYKHLPSCQSLKNQHLW